jgi:hypothetical protein
MFGNIFKKDQEWTTQGQTGAPQQGLSSSPTATPQASSAFSNTPPADPPIQQSAPMDSSMQQPSPANQSQQPMDASATPASSVGSDVPQDVIPQTQGPMDSTPSAQQYGTDAGAPQGSAPSDNQQANGSAPSQPGSPDGSQGSDMQALSHLDPRAAQCLTKSQEETRRIKQQSIEPEQLLLGLLYDQQVYNMLGEMSADGGQISKELQTDEKMGTYQGQPVLSKIALEVFDQAYRDAKMRGANFVSPEDVSTISSET